MATGYRIIIGADENGTPLVGAKACDEHGKRLDCVWGIQIPHRCTVRKNGKIEIMTPTDAKREGLEIIAHFH